MAKGNISAIGDSLVVTPLRNQAMDASHSAPLRYGVVWDEAGIPVADARDAVRTLLTRAGHPPDRQPNQDAQLVVSELVTNALRHAPGPGALLLHLAPDAARLDIAVRDSSPHAPLLQARDPRRVGGHGLRLVTRLCGPLRSVPLPTGKQVVARLQLRHGG